MIRSSQNREGFIRNPWSKENDGIHIDTFFKRIEQDAGKRCGCHYEIYERFCLDNLLDALYKLETLNKSHAEYVRKREHEKPRGSHRMMPSTGVKITTIIS